MDYLEKQLANGVCIPPVGYGTGVVRAYSRKATTRLRLDAVLLLSGIKHRDVRNKFRRDYHMDEIVEEAYESGFRMFDSARIYGWSEVSHGKALSGKQRDSFFVQTKLSDFDLNRAASPDTVSGNLDQSLLFLGTDSVDALLLHYPSGDWKQVYHDIEIEYYAGRVRSIGVCNFGVRQLEELLSECEVKPMINQIECHPFNTRKEIIDFCEKQGIVVQAHTPTARMGEKICTSSLLKGLAEKYKKTIAQIILRWHFQNGVIPIVSTGSMDHMKENVGIFDFELTPNEIRSIDGLNDDYVLLDTASVEDDNPKYAFNL